MRAVVVREFGAPERMALEDVREPEPGPGEILVGVRAAGVNFPDLLVVRGEYQILPEPPFSPGKEVAGIVEAVGNGVSEFRVGERVMAQMEYGGYGEKVVAKAANAAVMPSGMGFEEAAAFGLVNLTAYFALVRRARLLPGETVLVTGAAGGVGSAGVQLAKAFGATVIATASTEEKRALAMGLGADHAIEPDPGPLKERVRGLTGGRGADVILESVGGDLFDASLRAIAWEGRLVVIGFASGRIPTVKAGHVLVKNVSVVGLQVSDYREREPEAVREAYEVLLELYAKGRLRAHVAKIHPLENAAEALEEVRTGRAGGKVVLTTGGR
ncbi:MAG: NADPH:quinone oxidoreductase family protein [Actinomycetota bacterium]|nr:NADPH:quinone oxidoreductase family protein [Actinomycetota bacterium]